MELREAGQDVDAPTVATDPEFEAAHKALLADPSYQFEVATPKLSESPGWLFSIFENDVVLAFFRVVGDIMQVVFWIGLVAIAGLVIYFAYRTFAARVGRNRPQKAKPLAPYTPSEAVLRDLLREADALAASGDHAGAARLLLRRSIEDLERRRPGAISRAMTAREIGMLDLLTEKTREAYSAIATLVERAHYAHRPITESDYASARHGYTTIGGRRTG